MTVFKDVLHYFAVYVYYFKHKETQFFFLHFDLKLCFALYLDQLYEQASDDALPTMTKKDWRLNNFHILNLDFKAP